MTERKKKVPGRTTLKLRAIGKVERLKDKRNVAQDAEDAHLAKYIKRVGQIDTELKAAEQELSEFDEDKASGVDTFAGVESEDDNIRFGGTD